MGKEGLHLVIHALNEEGVKREDAPCAAEYYLENYHFIYENPDDDKVCLFLLTMPIPLNGRYLPRETRGHF